jgi:citrate lyase subunit beta / citryl-CoA lyase
MKAAMRSLLFVPGDRPDMVAKVGRGAQTRPDIVTLDLEDAIVPDAKEAARTTALDALAADRPEASVVLVRVNPPGTSWHDADVAAVASAAVGTVDGVILPKYESRDQLEDLRARLPAGHRIIVGIESAAGVADARDALAAAPDAAYLGTEDLIADLGGRRTAGNAEASWARAAFRLAGRLAGVPVIDQAVVAVRDDERFAREAREARDLGYHGKICLHPRQVVLAHEAFTPSDDEVAHARAVLAALDNAGRGGGVAVVDGAMVDAVHAAMARDVLARRGEHA